MANSSSDPTGSSRSRFKGCSSINQYEVLEKLGEGTFGEVHKARSQKTGALVALKKILMHNEKDGFPITALREIKLLKILSHNNVLQLVEMAIERPKNVHFSEAQIKCYMLQLLEGVRYLHDSHILHRDMKAANLLIDNNGCLRIADFGLARHYDEPVPQPGRGGGEARREYTALVVTRWYRPPELLLQLRNYTTAIDMWGVGCVFGEMFKEKPILTGNSDLNQIQTIFDLVGSPTEESMPGWSSLPGCEGVTSFDPRPGNLAQVFREQGSSAISLLQEFLRLDWRRRISAVDALQHPYFRNPPLPARPGDLPTYEHSHELDRRKFVNSKKLAPPPPAPVGGTVGMGPNLNGEWGAASGVNGGYASGPPSRDNRGAWGIDRPPRGHDNRPPAQYDRERPPRDPAYDQRRPPPYSTQPPPYSSQAPPQRPGWQQRNDGPPSSQGHGPAPSANGSRPNPPKDTYIPAYSSAAESARPPLRDERDRDHRPPRDDPRAYRDRDYPRDRDCDRDRDVRGPPPVNYGDRDRDRDRDRGGMAGGGRQPYSAGQGGDYRNTRPRSRSPRDRERDNYRR